MSECCALCGVTVIADGLCGANGLADDASPPPADCPIVALQNKKLTRVPARDEKGRLLPGNTANPGGRPRADEVRKLLADASPGAAKRLIELSNSGDESIALRASDSILDRHIGKPAVTITGEDGGPIRHEHGMSEAAERIAEEIARALLDEGRDAP